MGLTYSTVRLMRALALLILIVSACGRRLSPAECDAMLDRYLDMTEDDDPALVGVTGEPRAELRVQRIEERKKSAGYLEAGAHCATQVSAAEHACAMKAPSPNEWEACFEYH
ncbi:MAG TPA: hypothetical protein VLM85_29725 [Polyangiaceae bacterium]|nr:hypothetical protein [Polyangiaceae bacterium]